MSISLQTEAIPGKHRDPFLEQQMSKIEGAINAMSVPFTSKLVTSHYSVSATDRWLAVDASGGQVSVALLPSSSGRPIGIKKIDASVNTVTVSTVGSDKVDGAATFVMTTQYQFGQFVPDGISVWWLF